MCHQAIVVTAPIAELLPPLQGYRVSTELLPSSKSSSCRHCRAIIVTAAATAAATSAPSSHHQPYYTPQRIGLSAAFPTLSPPSLPPISPRACICLRARHPSPAIFAVLNSYRFSHPSSLPSFTIATAIAAAQAISTNRRYRRCSARLLSSTVIAAAARLQCRQAIVVAATLLSQSYRVVAELLCRFRCCYATVSSS